MERIGVLAPFSLLGPLARPHRRCGAARSRALQGGGRDARGKRRRGKGRGARGRRHARAGRGAHARRVEEKGTARLPDVSPVLFPPPPSRMTGLATFSSPRTHACGMALLAEDRVRLAPRVSVLSAGGAGGFGAACTCSGGGWARCIRSIRDVGGLVPPHPIRMAVSCLCLRAGSRPPRAASLGWRNGSPAHGSRDFPHPLAGASVACRLQGQDDRGPSLP